MQITKKTSVAVFQNVKFSGQITNRQLNTHKFTNSNYKGEIIKSSLAVLGKKFTLRHGDNSQITQKKSSTHCVHHMNKSSNSFVTRTRAEKINKK